MADDLSTPTEDQRARVQHDLRTPLTIIWGRTQLMERRLRRNTTLSAAERDDLLKNLAVITAAIEAQQRAIDAMNPDSPLDPQP